MAVTVVSSRDRRRIVTPSLATTPTGLCDGYCDCHTIPPPTITKVSSCQQQYQTGLPPRSLIHLVKDTHTHTRTHARTTLPLLWGRISIASTTPRSCMVTVTATPFLCVDPKYLLPIVFSIQLILSEPCRHQH